jgi:hypothetical protein
VLLAFAAELGSDDPGRNHAAPAVAKRLENEIGSAANTVGRMRK